MKIVGLMLARNEDWVIGLSARMALMWCDALVMILHACNDDTVKIVEGLVREYPERVWAQEREYSTWYEMQHRQDCLQMARRLEATHIALIDADEVLTGNALPSIRKHVERLEDGVMLQLPWLALRLGMAKWPEVGVMTSGMLANQNSIIAFKDHPQWCWRASADGYDFHQRAPIGAPYRSFHVFDDRSAGVMHLQFLSRRRLIAKQFLYQLTECLRWPRRDSVAKIVARYAPTVWESDKAQLSPIPDAWLAPYSDLLQYLHVDREPWQEAECRRIVLANPGIEKGLEDFGLVKQWRGGLVSW